jgi:starvation-inducible DNA-binding protein
MHKTLIDLPLAARKSVIAILQANLSNAVDLGIQAKLAHWNVRGATFIALHELFDKVSEQAFAHADMIAERIGQLGGVVHGTVQETAKETSLPKFSSKISKPTETVTAVAKALAAFGKSGRAAIESTDDLDDEVTSDLFTEVTRATDKMLWFVEAHLQ